MSNAVRAAGLYVHIPFCLKKCHYCDFVITTKRTSKDRQHFLHALEMEAQHAHKKFGRLKFNSLYLGGGTPSALAPVEFQFVFNILQNYFDFNPQFEFTVEVNPGDVNAEKIMAYQHAGVNRVSLGVQAFQPHLLKSMNRSHGVSDVRETVSLLKQAGINNLSMDMILNLPEQTLQDVEETVEGLLQFQPNQISVYDLDVHEKTVYGRLRHEGKLPLASHEGHAQMAEKVCQMLEVAGLIHYELTNFARPGFESRHNLIYWNNQSYLGLGPGAFSYMNNVRYQFSGSVEDYLAKVLKKDWANETEDNLSPEEIEKETLLTGIRLKEGLDLNRLTLIRQAFEKKIKPYIQEKLIEREESRVKFTAKGRLVADLVLSSFAQIKIDSET